MFIYNLRNGRNWTKQLNSLSISCENRNDCFEYTLDKTELDLQFFDRYEIGYISNYAFINNSQLRIISLPYATSTCEKKAEALGNWNLSNTIKTLYFYNGFDDSNIAVVIPETGYRLDIANLKNYLNIPPEFLIRPSEHLPENMKYGTCSPFLKKKDLSKGKVSKIIFDSESLIEKKRENEYDDFSFGLDNQLSLQMNYFTCFDMLKEIFGEDVVIEAPILQPGFRKKIDLKKGGLKVVYEVTSLNYIAAKTILYESSKSEGSIERETNLKIFNFVF